MESYGALPGRSAVPPGAERFGGGVTGGRDGDPPSVVPEIECEEALRTIACEEKEARHPLRERRRRLGGIPRSCDLEVVLSDPSLFPVACAKKREVVLGKGARSRREGELNVLRCPCVAQLDPCKRGSQGRTERRPVSHGKDSAGS
jgi:hypothetical protein